VRPTKPKKSLSHPKIVSGKKSMWRFRISLWVSLLTGSSTILHPAN
jgi:hypothetical protein